MFPRKRFIENIFNYVWWLGNMVVQTKFRPFVPKEKSMPTIPLATPRLKKFYLCSEPYTINTVLEKKFNF